MVKFSDHSDNPENNNNMKQIVLRHIEKIGGLMCQELTPGFWEKKPVKMQGGVMFSEEWHQDSRRAYCNAVDFLCDTVYPWADKVFKEKIDTSYIEQESDQASIEKDENYIKKMVILRRKIYRSIMVMFQRTGYLEMTDSVNE